MNIKDIRIPYNYLIQLSVKHLEDVRCILLTEIGIKNEYAKAIQISRDYLNVFNLQSYLIFGDMIYDVKSIPGVNPEFCVKSLRSLQNDV